MKTKPWKNPAAIVVMMPRPRLYTEKLQRVYDAFKKAHAQMVGNPFKTDLNGKLTPSGLRELHEALCRAAGLTAEEVVEDWNRRSPTDRW